MNPIRFLAAALVVAAAATAHATRSPAHVHGPRIRHAASAVDRACRTAERSRWMAAMPNAGPSASTGNAHRHPTRCASGGTSWIETIVSKNPSEV